MDDHVRDEGIQRLQGNGTEYENADRTVSILVGDSLGLTALDRVGLVLPSSYVDLARSSSPTLVVFPGRTSWLLLPSPYWLETTSHLPSGFWNVIT